MANFCMGASASGANDIDDSEAWLTELLAYGRERQRRRPSVCIRIIMCVCGGIFVGISSGKVCYKG